LAGRFPEAEPKSILTSKTLPDAIWNDRSQNYKQTHLRSRSNKTSLVYANEPMESKYATQYFFTWHSVVFCRKMLAMCVKTKLQKTSSKADNIKLLHNETYKLLLYYVHNYYKL